MVKSTLYPALAVISTLLLGSLVLRLGPIERDAKLRFECIRLFAMVGETEVNNSSPWFGKSTNQPELQLKEIYKQVQKVARISNLPWKPLLEKRSSKGVGEACKVYR